MAAAPPAGINRDERSEHGNWLNCTPNSGPLSSPAEDGSGGKFCCTISLAVRVEKALPPDDRYAPVIALAIAAPAAGMVKPSRSVLLVGSGALRIVAVAGAP